MKKYSSFTFSAWGTEIFIYYSESAFSEDGIKVLIAFFQKIDSLFSTYKNDSELMKIRSKKIFDSNYSVEMNSVINECLHIREITEGAFDPWSLPEGVDFSGYVKGWATQKGIEILNSFGIESVQINSAGDIHVSGGHQGEPWKIGVRDPEEAHKIVKVFEIWEGAVATSGTYERGSHIHDPFTGMIAIGARSATVIGPDGGLADALATALIVAGKDGAKWFAKPELSEYSAWIIERHSDQAWGINLK